MIQVITAITLLYVMCMWKALQVRKYFLVECSYDDFNAVDTANKLYKCNNSTEVFAL